MVGEVRLSRKIDIHVRPARKYCVNFHQEPITPPGDNHGKRDVKKKSRESRAAIVHILVLQRLTDANDGARPIARTAGFNP